MRKAYFGLSWIMSIILAVLPTNPFVGAATRIQRENWLGLICNIIFFPIFYFIDLFSILFCKDLTILA